MKTREKIIMKTMTDTATFPLMTGSKISSIPEHGVGQQEMTFRMAANAIWNKINFAIGLVREEGQLMDLLSEARALADSIVHHPNSGS